MPDNVLGPRVTGDSVYKPVQPSIPSKPLIYNGGHVEVEYEVSTRKVTGFNIFLDKEGKTIFMPIREAEVDLSMVDLVLLGTDVEKFAIKYGWSMIDRARMESRQGTLGTPEELDEYRNGNEAWMSPEQVAVLVDLRKESV